MFLKRLFGDHSELNRAVFAYKWIKTVIKFRVGSLVTGNIVFREAILQQVGVSSCSPLNLAMSCLTSKTVVVTLLSNKQTARSAQRVRNSSLSPRRHGSFTICLVIYISFWPCLNYQLVNEDWYVFVCLGRAHIETHRVSVCSYLRGSYVRCSLYPLLPV